MFGNTNISKIKVKYTFKTHAGAYYLLSLVSFPDIAAFAKVRLSETHLCALHTHSMLTNKSKI